jgi:hypothetical protein
MMSNTPDLSEARRILLEKYLRGDFPQAAKTATDSSQRTVAEVDCPRERVVEVQVGGSKRPFFFLHGHWKGTPDFCFSLARELGSDQPVYTLEPYQFDGLPVPPTVEEMAKAHIKSMRSVQPEGPYLLGGWCNGGLVAYEMARQLHAAGQKVDLLVLMDPFYLGYLTRRKVLRKVVSRLGNLAGLDQDKQLDWFLRMLYVYKPLQYMYQHLQYVADLVQNMSYGSSQNSLRSLTGILIHRMWQKAIRIIKGVTYTFAPDQEHEQECVVPAHSDSLGSTSGGIRQDYPGIFEWVGMGYVPPDLYPGKITFFWPRDQLWRTITGGWRKVAEAKAPQEIETYIVPGRQTTWKTNQLQGLAEHLRMCLAKAQREAI